MLKTTVTVRSSPSWYIYIHYPEVLCVRLGLKEVTLTLICMLPVCLQLQQVPGFVT